MFVCTDVFAVACLGPNLFWADACLHWLVSVGLLVLALNCLLVFVCIWLFACVCVEPKSLRCNNTLIKFLARSPKLLPSGVSANSPKLQGIGELAQTVRGQGGGELALN